MNMSYCTCLHPTRSSQGCQQLPMESSPLLSILADSCNEENVLPQLIPVQQLLCASYAEVGEFWHPHGGHWTP